MACGWGDCTGELLARSNATVVAIDRDCGALSELNCGEIGGQSHRLQRLQARAEQLPIADAWADLIFVQCGFLWFDAPELVAQEAYRVLCGGGVIAAIEPDYGGLIEHPAEIELKQLWLSAMRRAGGEPLIGRRLPGLLGEMGFDVHVYLLDRLKPSQLLRFDILAELPLSAAESEQFGRTRSAADQLKHQTFVHLPFSLVLGEKPR